MSLTPKCATCGKVNKHCAWLTAAAFSDPGETYTHGLCPDCERAEHDRLDMEEALQALYKWEKEHPCLTAGELIPVGHI